MLNYPDLVAQVHKNKEFFSVRTLTANTFNFLVQTHELILDLFF